MNLNLNSIFGQFSPDLVLFIPMTLTAVFLNLSWLSISNPSNWLPSRANLLILSFYQEVLKILFQQTNPNTAPWVSAFTAIFILIFSINVLGLLPYAFTSTSHISLTYSIGVPLWMSVNILGFYLAFNSRLGHLVPQGTPSYLIPFMVIIETISLFAQPIALGLRLAANLTAGHLLIFLLSTAIWTLSSSPSIASITLLIFFFLFLLEIGVACIQAYVFTALVNFYLSQNL
uniref:ATP synthase subunit a n=1 Tax=Patiria pectinifera TaxID=7594 RepID=ATP6_PATPE|nr:ATP synthase F0 subunit 6 [Patiria pectinifera]Q33823.1 RecName: Full=ATP synthase subunit a; AltName: Full=F-ATPase protein 6 [Patiria pectinifera]BAA03884.1 ATPase 6 [Patiria pectinifera]